MYNHVAIIPTFFNSGIYTRTPCLQKKNFRLTLKVVEEFLSNLACNISYPCLTTWHKLSTSANICTHTTLYSYKSQNCDKNSVI